MGCRFSSPLSEEERLFIEEQKLNQQIQIKNENDRNNNISVLKLLFLGPGESGKSTFLKQMINVYGKGFPLEAAQKYQSGVHRNCIEIIKTLCHQCQIRSELKSDTEDEITDINPELKSTVEYIKSLPTETRVSPDIAKYIFQTWQDPYVQKIYSLRAEYQLPDSASYFMNRLDDISKDSYLPSLDDILRVRIRTSGIISTRFDVPINNSIQKFDVLDVGGQKSERKKWIHCFQNVNAILFVVAISEYNQKLFEDETTNRMDEALHLWEQISNNTYFRKTCFVLFLNKLDLFIEKIFNVPLSVWRPKDEKVPLLSKIQDKEKYIEESKKYVREKFIKRIKHHQEGINFFIHFSQATDTNNAKYILSGIATTICSQVISDTLG